MKKLLFILLLSSCSEVKHTRWVCTCEEKTKASEFVSKNIKGANNMSDEEMEDVISELTNTAVKLNCHQKLFFISRNTWLVDWGDERNKIDSCESVIERVF